MAHERSLRLRARSGETFGFEPGALCLELGYTGGAGDRAAYETLHEPADLHRWLRGFVEVAVAPVTDADLLQAQHLREGIWQCMDARADGTPLPRAHVEQVNRFALKPSLAPVLDAAGGRRWAEPASCDAVLSMLARDLIEVLTGPLGDRVRRCGGDHCPLLFVDASRPGRRRWCSMQRCGNRAKVRAFRDRQHEERP